jgi:thiol-disulfide isomerase/thioredoxin
MRRGGAGLIAAVLALAGCKTTDPKPTDKKSDRDTAAAAASRPRGKPAWLEDLNRQPGANTGVPKADSWADPKDANFNVAGEVRGVLAGRVLDPAGRGAKNVFIKIEAADAKPAEKAGAATGILTDANGYFMVRGLKPGQAYNLTAEAQWEGKQVYGVIQTAPPKPTLVIPLREDVTMPPVSPRPGATAPPPPAPGSTEKLPPPDDLIPRTGMPTAPPPAEEAWSPGGTPATKPVPPSISAPATNPAPALPPPSPIDVPRPNPERTADGPKDPRWPPPASIPGPVLPPSPPVPPLPPPPKDPDGQTTSRPRRQGANFTLLDSLERPWEFPTNRSGSLVLVEFMTTTCVPCKQAIPFLTDVQSRYGTAGLEVIAVACDDGPVSERIARARRYHQDHNLNYSLYVEPGTAAGQVRDRFGVEGYPTVVLLDAAGAVVWKGHPADRAALEDAIRRNLGK